MGAARTHNKTKRALCAHQSPSFVYRQDGYELSYKVRGIIQFPMPFVKSERPTAIAVGLPFKGFGKKRGRKLRREAAHGYRRPSERSIHNLFEQVLRKLKIK